MLDICPDKKLETKLWTKIMKAVRQFKMIETGDKIAVGISGGKDSLTLLRFIALFKQYGIFDFDFIAIHMIADISASNIASPQVLADLMEKWGIKYDFEHVSLTDPKYNKKNKVDCYWCSAQKRRILFKKAEEHNCNKIAFGHHMDDIVITNFMNLFHLSVIQTMRVNHAFFDGKYHIIRPLMFLREDDTIQYAKLMGFPSLPCNCAVGKNGRREKLQKIFKNLELEIPEIAESVLWAFIKNNEKINLLEKQR